MPWWQAVLCQLVFWLMIGVVALVGACVDPGGSIRERLDNLNPSPIVGTCASSCTMRLKVACITPNARLGFHGASSPSPTAAQWGTQVMANHYPEPLRAWYLSGPANLSGSDVVWLTGEEVISLGAKPCP